MSRIFAYITHKAGVADDTALELIAAAKKIDPAASPIAIVTGFGAELDAVCESSQSQLQRGLEDLERGARLSQRGSRPPGAGQGRSRAEACCWLAHDHFGIDLAPGLSIKLNAAYVPDVLDIDSGRQQSHRRAPGIWRPGQRTCSLRHFHRRSDQRSSRRVQA